MLPAYTPAAARVMGVSLWDSAVRSLRLGFWPVMRTLLIEAEMRWSFCCVVADAAWCADAAGGALDVSRTACAETERLSCPCGGWNTGFAVLAVGDTTCNKLVHSECDLSTETVSCTLKTVTCALICDLFTHTVYSGCDLCTHAVTRASLYLHNSVEIDRCQLLVERNSSGRRACTLRDGGKNYWPS